MSVRMRIYSLILFFCFCIVSVYANSAISKEPHQNSVSALAYFSDGSVISAGQDGFLIRWDQQGNGEHYQFTDFGIKFIAASPSGMDIAIFETDGFSVFRLTVFNWATKTKKWTKELDSDLASLTYSTRGTYVLAGSMSLKGMLFFNSFSGAQQNIIRDTTGIASFADTGASETSMVLYTLSGTIAYYNLRTGKLKTSFMTETNLSQTVLYKNNLILAGVKNNTIYLIDALSGSIVEKIEAQNPVLTTTSSDQELHYFSSAGQGKYEYHNLKNNSDSAAQTPPDENTDSDAQIPAAIPVSDPYFSIPEQSQISCAIKRGSSVQVGTTNGMLYSLEQSKTGGSVVVQQISRRERIMVVDIDAGEHYTWFLTAKTLYWLHGETDTVGHIPVDIEYTDVTACDIGAILWSRGQRTAISLVSLATEGQAEFAGEQGNFNPAHKLIRLYSPSNAVQSVTVTEQTLTLVEGNSIVQLIQLSDGKIMGTYRGTGYQCAALSGNTLFVGKTIVTNPRSALISINTVTGEIVMEKNTASVIYSLVPGKGNTLFGLASRSTGSSQSTEIFSYQTERRTTATLFSVNADKLNSYVDLSANLLFTDITAPNMTIIDTTRMNRITIPRSYTYAKKAVSVGDYYYVLNTDGTVTVYTKTGIKPQATWAIDTNGAYMILDQKN